MNIEAARYLVSIFLALALIYRVYDTFWGPTSRAFRPGSQYYINAHHRWAVQRVENDLNTKKLFSTQTKR